MSPIPPRILASLRAVLDMGGPGDLCSSSAVRRLVIYVLTVVAVAALLVAVAGAQR
ncbi:hypothetical protein [Streptomyces sp. AS58]|uniref:hypothetical protein n=1 Tax=Streptomyces sp. AS58 TaxID=1519489 RepID=UPI000A988F0B|nr:hypothetical protein [Streptomyces sp. AS58]